MTTVAGLLPGDTIEMPMGGSATFVARTDHPLWPGLQLVVWRMPSGSPVGDWSHDALDARQDVGIPIAATPDEREARLRDALLGGS